MTLWQRSHISHMDAILLSLSKCKHTNAKFKKQKKKKKCSNLVRPWCATNFQTQIWNMLQQTNKSNRLPEESLHNNTQWCYMAKTRLICLSSMCVNKPRMSQFKWSPGQFRLSHARYAVSGFFYVTRRLLFILHAGCFHTYARFSLQKMSCYFYDFGEILISHGKISKSFTTIQYRWFPVEFQLHTALFPHICWRWNVCFCVQEKFLKKTKRIKAYFREVTLNNITITESLGKLPFHSSNSYLGNLPGKK